MNFDRQGWRSSPCFSVPLFLNHGTNMVPEVIITVKSKGLSIEMLIEYWYKCQLSIDGDVNWLHVNQGIDRVSIKDIDRLLTMAVFSAHDPNCHYSGTCSNSATSAVSHIFGRSGNRYMYETIVTFSVMASYYIYMYLSSCKCVLSFQEFICTIKLFQFRSLRNFSKEISGSCFTNLFHGRKLCDIKNYGCLHFSILLSDVFLY